MQILPLCLRINKNDDFLWSLNFPAAVKRKTVCPFRNKYRYIFFKGYRTSYAFVLQIPSTYKYTSGGITELVSLQNAIPFVVHRSFRRLFYGRLGFPAFRGEREKAYVNSNAAFHICGIKSDVRDNQILHGNIKFDGDVVPLIHPLYMIMRRERVVVFRGLLEDLDVRRT